MEYAQFKDCCKKIATENKILPAKIKDVCCNDF
jgi:hypothetical protein